MDSDQGKMKLNWLLSSAVAQWKHLFLRDLCLSFSPRYLSSLLPLSVAHLVIELVLCKRELLSH